MSRGRIIKPEFWTDGAVVGLTPLARLLLIGSWNFALCDNGHLPDDALALKLKVIPLDNVNPSELIDELIDAGRVARVTIADRTFLQIHRFSDHQKTDSRWKARCPACNLAAEQLGVAPLATTPELATTPQSLAESRPNSPDLAARGGREGEGKGVGEEMRGRGNVDESTPPPRKCSKHLHDPDSPPCGACKDARIAREDWDRAHPPVAPVTPSPSSPRDCPKHPHYPHPSLPLGCPKCNEEALS